MNTPDNNTKYELKALMSLFAVVIIWGLDYVGIEYCTRHMSVMLVSASKLVFGGLLLFLFCLFKFGKIHYEKKDLAVIIACGVFGQAGYLNLEAYGIDKVSSPVASLIMATVPVIGLIADRLIYKEKITWYKTAAIIASILGVALLVMTAGEKISGNFSGVFAIFMAAFIWTGYIIVTKKYFIKYSLLPVMSIILLSGAAASVPLVFIFDKPIYCDPDPVLFIILFITAIVSCVLSEVMYGYSISKLSITLVSMAENVLPLVTVSVAWIFLGSTLTLLQMFGGIIIIASVTVITMEK